ncbi:MAG: FecR domain-containing protein [Syntrophaceae bacterium]|nr:FecR domain-containing protein [Syntrophaceae bacterium]
MNKRFFKFAAAVVVLVFLLCPAVSMAKELGVHRQSWLFGIIFKLKTMKDKEIAGIRKYDAEIQKCNATIRASEDIISKARQKGNIKAEQIAREALRTAQEAKRKNEEMKSLAELNKKRAETAYASVYNQFSKEAGGKEEIRGVVSSVSGNAFILLKRDNATIPLSDDRAGFLQPGDEIWTLGKSSAELQMLDGRGSVRLGEYSRFRMEEDSAGAQVINIMNGRIHAAVDKLDEHQKMIEDKIRAYKEDLKTVNDEIKQKLVEAHDKFLRWSYQKKFEVRTNVIMSVRGTQFLVYEDEKMGTELIVLEGSVEMKGIKGDKTIIVNAGYKGTAAKDGILSDPEKIDLSKIERWWEK